ncbi:MAG TPA: T9SS type A sorting domain-containing protein [Patescibacteria group bacterium]|nr:T9SS type A sorting domain-containing protein [Patescibacteria group bacterium]
MKKLFAFLLFALAPNFAQAQHTQNVTFTHVDKIVNATFTAPSLMGKFPVIIINPGSGPNDRDGTIPMQGGNIQCLYPQLLGTTLKSYKGLGDALVGAGYAVLRYDKLEYTYSTSLGELTFKKLWLPVESAINYVKTRADVDTSRIILLGHSEGAALIPIIAEGRTDVRALISLAGARTPFDSLLAYQLVYIAERCSGDVTMAKMQSAQILRYFHLIRSNTWNASTPPLFGVPAAVWGDYVRATDSVALRYNRANLPALFVGLEQDFNVPPAELARFKHDVRITKDFWNIPGLNHYMTPNDDPHVSKALADTIIYWLHQQGISTGIRSEKKDRGELLKVAPNPFTQQFSVSLLKTSAHNVEISVKNILGQEVVKHFLKSDGEISRATFNGDNLPPGVYLLDVHIDGERVTQKVVKQ